MVLLYNIRILGCCRFHRRLLWWRPCGAHNIS